MKVNVIKNDVDVTKDVEAGITAAYDGNPYPLLMDVYMPKNDKSSKKRRLC